jgi:hypothetical protein
MELLQISWKHPRVVAVLAKRGYTNRYQLTPDELARFADSLQAEVERKPQQVKAMTTVHWINEIIRLDGEEFLGEFDKFLSKIHGALKMQGQFEQDLIRRRLIVVGQDLEQMAVQGVPIEKIIESTKNALAKIATEINVQDITSATKPHQKTA